MPRQPLSPRRLKGFLFLADTLGLALFFHLAHQIRFEFDPDYAFHAPDLIVVMLLALGTGYVFDVFDLNSRVLGVKTPSRFWISTAASGAVIALYLYLSGTQAANLYGRGVMAMAFITFAAAGSALRYGLLYWVRSRGRHVRWLALGRVEHLVPFHAELKRNPIDGSVVFLADSSARASVPAELPVSGTFEELEHWLLKDWSGVVVCVDGALQENVVETLLHARLNGTRVYNLTDFYEEVWRKVPVYYLDRSWLLLTQGFGLLHNRVGLRFKEVCDVLGAILLLPIALPLIAVGGALVALESGFPVIYRQTRTGKGGRDFTIYKLRTMRQDAEKHGAQWSAQNDNRILFFGKFLRKSRIDELPQLFNVLKGDMSFIGPRPERPEFNARLEKQIPHYNLRHSVRPGITGWAQVLYQYGASVDDSREKLQYDLYYIKNYGITMDCMIILKTIRSMLFGAGR